MSQRNLFQLLSILVLEIFIVVRNKASGMFPTYAHMWINSDLKIVSDYNPQGLPFALLGWLTILYLWASVGVQTASLAI